MMEWYPLVVLAIGVAVVLALILALRINAFLALIVAAFVVSLLAPGEMAGKISRVAAAFGSVAGAIGIVIALAAVIGKTLMDSGAAERIVRSITGALGESRSPVALMGSGYVLSIPVFFDTVFYLLVPLARSLWKTQRKNYILYVTAIVAGAAVTHSMVPPTPGPLFMANALGVDLGTMILMGGLIGLPMAIVGLAVCGALNRWQPIEMRPYPGEEDVVEAPVEQRLLPPLWLSLLPVVLPVVLISANTVAVAIAGPADAMTDGWRLAVGITGILGNPNLALMFSAAIGLAMVARYRGRTLAQLAGDTEHALMSGGIVILITAAGGAFGAMLREAGIQGPIQAMVGGAGTAAGMTVLLSAFGVASLIKFAQGSGTVSMITTSSMFAAMGFSAATLGFHPVYLACAIGSGSLVGDWMNNSGFWVFAKMSVLTTEETLKSWTILTAALGVTGIIVTLLAALILPMA
jgi:gluconate:H+ symporter, GntP family